MLALEPIPTARGGLCPVGTHVDGQERRASCYWGKRRKNGSFHMHALHVDGKFPNITDGRLERYNLAPIFHVINKLAEVPRAPWPG